MSFFGSWRASVASVAGRPILLLLLLYQAVSVCLSLISVIGALRLPNHTLCSIRSFHAAFRNDFSHCHFSIWESASPMAGWPHAPRGGRSLLLLDRVMDEYCPLWSSGDCEKVEPVPVRSRKSLLDARRRRASW